MVSLPTIGGSSNGSVIGDGSGLTARTAENGLIVPVQASWRAETSWPLARLAVNTGDQSSPQSFGVDPCPMIVPRLLSRTSTFAPETSPLTDTMRPHA